MSYLANVEVVGILEESTQGTLATPFVVGSYIMAEISKPKPVAETIKRDYHRASLDQMASRAGGVSVEIGIKVEAKGSGTTTVPWLPFKHMLVSAGHINTSLAIYDPTSVPASANFYTIGKSVSIEYYVGSGVASSAFKQIITGAVCTSLKLSGEAGKPMFWDFTFKGILGARTQASLPACTYNLVQPPLLESSSFSFQGYSAILKKFSIDWGLESTMREDSASLNGVKGFMVTGRKPKGQITIELPPLATKDFITNMTTNVEDAMTFVTPTVSGNTLAFSFLKAQVTGFQYSDQNGLLTADLDLQFNQSTGDDWFKHTQT